MALNNYLQNLQSPTGGPALSVWDQMKQKAKAKATPTTTPTTQQPTTTQPPAGTTPTNGNWQFPWGSWPTAPGGITTTPGTTTPGTTTPTTGNYTNATPPYSSGGAYSGDEDASGILSYLLKTVPSTYNWANNALMDSVNQTNQLSTQALESLQTKMNEIKDIFNTYGGALPTAQSEMMSGLTSADQAYGNILNKYAGFIENGTVPEGIAANLDKIRQNSYTNLEKRIGKDSNSAIREALNKFGANGMIDSDYFRNAMNDIAASGFSELSTAGRDIENSYLQSMMAYPFEMFNTLIPQYGNLTTNLKDTAKTAYSSAESTFNDLMKGALEQADLPIQYFGLAQQLPGWFEKIQSGNLSSLNDIYKTLIQKDLLEKKIDAEKEMADEANDFDWTDLLF